jgi:ADP-ribose pyrophosphatase YjhB (NUDIX family)
MLIRNDEVVLVRHRYGNLWVLPGGRQEKKENSADAGKREVKEECNIEVLSFDRTLGIYENTHQHRNDTVTVMVSTNWVDHGQKTRLEILDRSLFNLHDLPQSTSAATKLRIAEYLSGEQTVHNGPWY